MPSTAGGGLTPPRARRRTRSSSCRTMLPYCSIIERKQKKTIDEMEQEFLQAIMSNEELDNLKEELMWEGSSVVMLSNNRVHARMS